MPIDYQRIVDTASDTYMKNTDTPGMSVALVDGHNQQFFNYGFINTQQSAPVTENTIFGIGSVTKVFTAILLQDAVNNGRMNLNDLVVRWLPPEVLQKATDLKICEFLDLATHTAGMPSEGGGRPADTLFADEPPTNQLIQWWQNFKAHPSVATCWSYSNIAFVTLGYAVAGYNPNQYNQLLADVVTTPLKMPNTASSIQPGATLAQGYTGDQTNTNKAPGINADLKSNAADMMNFLNACISPDTSTPIGKAIQGTQQIHWAGNNCEGNTPLNFKMGLAWQISEMTSGDQLASKDGKSGLGGYEAWVGVIPQQLMGVALLSNKDVEKSLAPNTIGATGRLILQNILDAANGT